MPDKRTIKIASWNVNGLRATLRSGRFHDYIERYQPDILCLQEVKALPHQIEHELSQYQTFWNPADKKGYSGTAILAKISPAKVENGFPEEIGLKYPLVDSLDRDAKMEGRLVTAEFDEFIVASVYTPNAKDDLSRLSLVEKYWDPALAAYFSHLQQRKPLIAAGDFNVARHPEDLARPIENEGRKGYTKQERAGFEMIIGTGLIDSFRLFHKGDGYYTWWSHWAQARQRNIGWRIDYCLVSEILRPRIVSSEIHPEVLGSDHCPVSVTLSWSENH